SGSSKWMILAPILIPMLYAIGFSPALTTVAYRIGDSATNAIAPISSDVALIVGLLGKYNTDKSKTPGMGTVFAGCMPYAIATMITELLILGVWWAFNLPLGPGVTMFIK
ncbi:MAG: AbgT family transporter, partial [Clostridium sp.]